MLKPSRLLTYIIRDTPGRLSLDTPYDLTSSDWTLPYLSTRQSLEHFRIFQAGSFKYSWES